MKLQYLLVSLVAMLGSLLIWLSTPFGIGTSPDSVTYLVTADNLLSGHGITTTNLPGVYTPLTQYPPLYSLALAIGGWILGMPYQSAHILAGLIFAGNIFLVGFILIKTASHAHWPAVMSSVLMLCSPVMLGIHVMAWSEPLFILLAFLAIITLAQFVQNSKVIWLVLAAILTSLAFLTRYAGITLVASGVLGILLLSKGTIIRRIMDSLVYSVLSAGPSILVLLGNQATTGSATNRSLAFHPITGSLLLQGVKTVNSWFGLPELLSGWVHILFSIGVGILLIGMAGLLPWPVPSNRSGIVSQRKSLHPITVLMLLFICIYVAFLLISISFVDANTPLDNRILSPVCGFALVIITQLLAGFFNTPKMRSWWFLPVTIFILILGVYSSRSFSLISSAREHGLGYSTPVWQNSELINQLKTISPETAIYSNVPEAIVLFARHPAARLPRIFNLSAQQINPEYSAEMEQLGEMMANGQAVIVYFDYPERQTNPGLKDIQEILDLQLHIRAADGEIYTVTQSTGP